MSAKQTKKTNMNQPMNFTIFVVKQEGSKFEKGGLVSTFHALNLTDLITHTMKGNMSYRDQSKNYSTLHDLDLDCLF